jgi:GT2 family glycosyltransferase
MIYIVIPVFNRWHYTNACLQSLFNQTYTQYTVIVVDHGSTDNTSQFIQAQYPHVVILTGNSSMWWTAATNLGVTKALSLSTSNSDYILSINNDLIVNPNYLQLLLNGAQAKPHCIIGSVTVDVNNPDQLDYAGTKWNPWTAKYRLVIPLPQSLSSVQQQQRFIESDLLPGRGTLFPINAFIELGLYDAINFPHYMGDEDFSLRCVKANYKLLIDTQAVVLSALNDTGLNNVYTKMTIRFWVDTFTSTKSANKFSVRWRWALKHGKIPLVYFCLDTLRVTISQIRNALK